MNMNDLIFGADGKIRSGWRFAIFVLAIVLAGLFFGTAAIALLSAISVSTQPGTAVFLFVNGLVSLAVVLIVGWLCGKYLEGLPYSALGASPEGHWARNLIIGLIAGGLTFALGAGIGILAGGLSFSINPVGLGSIAATLLLSLAIFASAAAFEEALFRGYILQTFARSGLAWPAIFATSIIFGAVHLGNPGANWISSANTAIAGIWFGVAYLKTRDLWLPFGLHLAWNWTQGSIFGVEVSGLTEIVKHPVLRETDLGPAWLTGGDYGIEGGIVTTAALIISTAVIWFIPLEKDGAQNSEFSV